MGGPGFGRRGHRLRLIVPPTAALSCRGSQRTGGRHAIDTMCHRGGVDAVGHGRRVAAPDEVVKALLLADGHVRRVVRRHRQEAPTWDSPFGKWRRADFAEARRVHREQLAVEEMLVAGSEPVVGVGIGIALPLLERYELLGLLFRLWDLHVLQGKSNFPEMGRGRDDVKEIRHLVAD